MTTRQEREKANRQYLKDKVDQHLNKLIIELLRDKPEDVLSFILSWAQKQKGEDTAVVNTINQVDDAPVVHENTPEEPMQAPEEEEQDIAGQVEQQEEAVETMDMENCEREDKGDYCPPEVESGDEEDEEEGDNVPDMDAFLESQKKISGVCQRISVSAEVYGQFNKKEEYTPKIVEKTPEAKAAIMERLNQSFMFANLDDKEKDIVIDAMEECKFNANDVVIKQGDDGAVLYLVFSGSLKCNRKMNKDDEEETYLKTYKEGEAFGELALLYNAPRAATIIAEDESVCYSLDRDCFNHIVKESTMKRRDRFEDFVSKIELLQCLDVYERSKITDCLNTDKYKDGETVITMGEVGNKFYFVEEGTAKATKPNESGEEETVLEYKENDYFGELALLKDEPRAASVIATSDLTVAWIDRYAFKRLLGPLEKVLERNAEKYTNLLGESS